MGCASLSSTNAASYIAGISIVDQLFINSPFMGRGELTRITNGVTHGRFCAAVRALLAAARERIFVVENLVLLTSEVCM